MPYLGNPAQQRFSSPRAASVYSGDGSTVAFTLEEVVSTDEDILVSVDGVIQEPSVAYAVSSGTTLTFTAAPSTNSGNNIFVYYIARTFGSVSMPDGQNVNASTLNTSGNVVFNEASADVDFRVESNGNANMLFIDGGNDAVGIGNNNPADYGSLIDNLVIGTTSGNNGMTIVSGDDAGGRICFADNTASPQRGMIEYSHGDDAMFFNANGATRMKIDSTGAVTMPNQPAFQARPASTQSNFAVGSNVTVVFGTEIFDQNADFASNTFTAPITGKYQLQVHLRVQSLDSASAYYYILIKTSNRQYINIVDPDYGQDNVYLTFQLAALADMDANDTAFIQIYQANGAVQTDINDDSSFSGYLVA